MLEHNSFETWGLTVLIMFSLIEYLKLQSHIFKVHLRTEGKYFSLFLLKKVNYAKMNSLSATLFRP